MELPAHVIKKSDKWYENLKTGKFIHADHISGFLDRYWSHIQRIKSNAAPKRMKATYKKNVKLAERRWNNE